MYKPYFEEIQQVSKTIKTIVKKNRRNSFITEIKSAIKSNGEVVKNFPVFFKKVLLPISYERIFAKEKKNQAYNSLPAVGKWFGTKGWKNISHLSDNSLIESLKQEHIDLVPDKDKRAIAQDFFDYSRVFSDNNNQNTLNVPMNVKTTLYKFNWIQIRDMAGKTKSGSSYYNSNDDKDHDNYIYPREANSDAIINEGIIEYNARQNTITVSFMFDKLLIEEINIETITDEEDSKYIFLSERLFDWSDLNSSQDNKLHEFFVGDIETLLTPEIKQAVNIFITKQKTIQEDWNKIQMKYAHKILQKGNI
jgi:hypothetical protein